MIKSVTLRKGSIDFNVLYVRLFQKLNGFQTKTLRKKLGFGQWNKVKKMS